MLVLARRTNDRIRCRVSVDELEQLAREARAEADAGQRDADEGLLIDLVVVDVIGGRVRLGLTAPQAVEIWRAELLAGEAA